ncbi:DUF349 domain-containing protein [Janibacter sp. G56]|uniref:DUF349 domain-containing protein n=1 Tax=Janibacter sp. G56 TaxID=3418717 RepID=UPI003CFE00F2
MTDAPDMQTPDDLGTQESATQPETPVTEAEVAPAEPEVAAEAEAEAAAHVAEAAAPEAEPAATEPVAEAEPAAAEAEPAAPEAEPVTPEAAAPEAEPAAPEAPAAPKPTPRPGPVPSPAALARTHPKPAVAAQPVIHPPSDSAAHGRVDDDGTVYVTDGTTERAVGSYPGATADEALQYFARKYDELFASAELLHARLSSPEVTAREIHDGLKSLKEHTAEPMVVGDLPKLAELVESVETGLAAKREAEATDRAAAKLKAGAEREALVAEAEAIAGQPEQKIQWKVSSARMRELLDVWKEHQRTTVRLDKDVESSLWQRFSKARNGFDKARRVHFAQLEGSRSEAKAEKEQLVADAERLSTSTDWAATAGAFKRLMDQWRQAGRASRADDDALWERFRAAQDAFFTAKDALAEQEDEANRGNLEIKEALLAEAEKILPVKDLEAAKASLRTIQDKWEKAGKVPRADVDRMEKGMRRIETAVREAEDARWTKSNPEVAARARSMVTQLEASVASAQADLDKATAAGNEKKIKELTAKLEAQQVWLDQARAGLNEFGG